MSASRYNDPAHLPLPMPQRPERDEDEAFERSLQRQLDADLADLWLGRQPKLGGDKSKPSPK